MWGLAAFDLASIQATYAGFDDRTVGMGEN